MGFLSSIFGGSKNGRVPRFVTEKSFLRNLANQTMMSPATLAELRNLGVPASASRKLNCYFYTNAEAKARTLESALQELGYKADIAPSAVDDGSTFRVNGRSTLLQMDEETVVAWTERMCRLGFEHDCEFDGWETNVREQRVEE